MVVIERVANRNRKAWWRLKCDCGNESLCSAANLKRKPRPVKSCGCEQGRRPTYGPRLSRKKKHSYRTKEKNAWMAMWDRCTNDKKRQWKDYGGRGITVDPLFESYDEFIKEVGYAPSPTHSMGRIRNDEGYKPGNLRWETKKQQQNNTRFNRILEYKGRSQTTQQWADELGLNETYISHRLARGWSVERAIEEPVIPRK